MFDRYLQIQILLLWLESAPAPAQGVDKENKAAAVRGWGVLQ